MGYGQSWHALPQRVRTDRNWRGCLGETRHRCVPHIDDGHGQFSCRWSLEVWNPFCGRIPVMECCSALLHREAVPVTVENCGGSWYLVASPCVVTSGTSFQIHASSGKLSSNFRQSAAGGVLASFC